MPETTLRVELLTHTPEPVALIYAAFRQCYHAGFVADMWPRLLAGEIDPQTQARFVGDILESGHASPIEHVSLTFAISGVSRALTHQLVRHRIASYSQQSQRYVDGKDFNYIVPPSIAKNSAALARFNACMAEISAAYDDLSEILAGNANSAGGTYNSPKDKAALAKIKEKVRQDARFVLPQAAETRLIMTMNCRSLLNFFEERCCLRAQWEIRALAEAMLKLAQTAVPVIFDLAGAKCIRLGYCPEGEQFTCGRMPRRTERGEPTGGNPL